MKRFLWVFVLFLGVGLLGCTPGDTVETTRIAGGEEATATAVAAETIGPLDTAVLETLSPTSAAATQMAITMETAIAANPQILLTLTPQYTPTFIPTPTEEVHPSPTPVVELLTPIDWVSIEASFPLDNDLLFINSGHLSLWMPRIPRITAILPLPDSDTLVSDWRVSGDGQTVLVATTAVDENAPGFTLWLFDVESREISELWSEADAYLSGFSLAADGRTAAFITGMVSAWEGGGAETVKVIERERGAIMVLSDCSNTISLDRGGGLFDYTNHCESVVAAPDGRSWLWNDIVGVWQGEVGQSPQMLVAHEFPADEWPRIYRPTEEWSPDGRYQLLRGRYFEGGSSERFVLDMTTGSTVQLPVYDEILDRFVEWLWTADGRLTVLRQPTFEVEEDNFAELWRVEGDELVLDASLVLPAVENSQPMGWSDLGDGRLAFVINHSDYSDAATRNLYLIDSFDSPPRPLVSLPPWPSPLFFLERSLTWQPDAVGVIYIMIENGRTRSFYIPADGSILYDLSDILGRDVDWLHWLP